MNDSQLYKELGILTRNRNKWEESIPTVAALLSHDSVKIQAKVLWLLGEMGLAYPALVSDCIDGIASFLDSDVPLIYEHYMPVFEKLLYDANDKVRMEAPEIFRVLGKRSPEFVKPYMEQLRRISETDSNPVVRIHCLGAIKAASSYLGSTE